METVQQNGRFTLFSSKFPSNKYSILYARNPGNTEAGKNSVFDLFMTEGSYLSFDMHKLKLKHSQF